MQVMIMKEVTVITDRCTVLSYDVSTSLAAQVSLASDAGSKTWQDTAKRGRT
jgi:hypothetical protein